MTLTFSSALPDAEIASICRRYQIKELSLFGSMARDEARPDSDIDLLVEHLPGAKRGLIRQLSAQQTLAERRGRSGDFVSKTDLREELKDHVLVEAKTIYAA